MAVMANRFFIYARKSTDVEEKQVLSIPQQLDELRAYALKERLTVVREYTEAMTAKTPGRIVFGQMLDAIERGEANGIISWHPDRLARNSVDGGRIIYLLDCEKLSALKCPTFWFENTPQGKFMLSIAFGQSKYFVDNLSENVKRAVRHKLKAGEWPGWAPTGYLNDRNSRKVVVDPVKGPLVRRLFEAYASGRHSVASLRRAAAEWGLLSRQGNPLAPAVVFQFLRNPFYYGLMRMHGELHEGTHPPLISQALFQKVQELLSQKGRPQTLKKHHFPLLGLAHCESCGCGISAERQRTHSYYRCTKKRCKCLEPYIREEELSEQIREAIANVALPTETYSKMISELAKERNSESQTVTPLRQNLEAVQTKINRLLDLHLDGAVDKSEYVARKKSLLNQKLQIEEKLKESAEGATVWLEQFRNFLITAHQAGPRATDPNFQIQKEFFEKIGSNVRLGGKTLKFSYELPWSILAKNRENKKWLPYMKSKGPLPPPRNGYMSSLQAADKIGARNVSQHFLADLEDARPYLEKELFGGETIPNIADHRIIGVDDKLTIPEVRVNDRSPGYGNWKGEADYRTTGESRGYYEREPSVGPNPPRAPGVPELERIQEWAKTGQFKAKDIPGLQVHLREMSQRFGRSDSPTSIKFQTSLEETIKVLHKTIGFPL